MQISPIDFTSDGQEMLIMSETSYPYVYKSFFIDLTTSKIEMLYTDDTVLRNDAITFPGTAPLLAPDDRTVLYIDYTNLHQQPAGPDRLKMKTEDNRYDLVSINRITKEKQTLYDSKTSFDVIGFVE